MADEGARPNQWPSHMRVGSLRFVRSSARYDETIEFYRELVGLPVIDRFQDSYGEDGTIFGLPDWPDHLEVVRSHGEWSQADPYDGIVFYLEDERAVEEATQRLRASGVSPSPTQHPYWDDWGGVCFLDPDGRQIVYVSWVYGPRPGSREPDDVGG